MRWAISLLAAALFGLGAAASGAQEAPRWIEAEGLAFIHSPGDRDAARRRALGEALISAALAGGASLRGHTVLYNARVISDVAILRPTGRVLRHDVLFAQVDQGHWRVRVKALVGPAQQTSCLGHRRITLNVTPPNIDVAQEAGAWSLPVAQRLGQDIVAALRHHPFVIVERVAERPQRRVPAALDYTTLTVAAPEPIAGNDRLDTRIEIEGRGAKAELVLTLTLTDPSGRARKRIFRRKARASDDGLLALLADARRPKAEARLIAGLLADVDAYFKALACRAPEARLSHVGHALTAPLGRRQGLKRTSLAFVDVPEESFGLLEIVELRDRSAT